MRVTRREVLASSRGGGAKWCARRSEAVGGVECLRVEGYVSRALFTHVLIGAVVLAVSGKRRFEA